MKEPKPDSFTSREYAAALRKYRAYKASIEEKRIAGFRVHMKICESCGEKMFNVSKTKRFCFNKKCHIKKYRNEKNRL